MIYFKGENNDCEKSFIFTKYEEQVSEISVQIEDGENIPLKIYLDIETAIKFKKAITHEIQKAKYKGGNNETN